MLWNGQDISERIKRQIKYRPKIISEKNRKRMNETEINIWIKKAKQIYYIIIDNFPLNTSEAIDKNMQPRITDGDSK